MIEDEAQPIIIHVTEEGRFLGMDSFPEVTLISPNAMDEDFIVRAPSDQVYVRFHNATATYAKIGETDYGDWVCSLRSATYEPPVSP